MLRDCCWLRVNEEGLVFGRSEKKEGWETEGFIDGRVVYTLGVVK